MSTSLKALVCVVDADAAIRKAVARMLYAHEYTLECFDSADAFLRRAPHDGPSCVILAACLPVLSGIEVFKILLKRQRNDQVIFISGQGTIPMCVEVLKLGAIDFLTKPLDYPALLQSVEIALRQSRFALRRREDMERTLELVDRLTRREREVLSFVIAGRLNKETALDLNTAEKTIKVHRGNITKKLGVSNLPGLVRIAQAAGIKPACRGPKSQASAKLDAEGLFI